MRPQKMGIFLNTMAASAKGRAKLEKDKRNKFGNLQLYTSWGECSIFAKSSVGALLLLIFLVSYYREMLFL